MSPLKQKILSVIRAAGPISVADYMLMALYDSQYGYYTTRDPFGVEGDFTTAPEVSQIFGELIGAFLVQAWEDRGKPKRFHLVELGPGRGTLMADILRAAKVRPVFGEAAHVTLVETSPKLRAAQQNLLGGGVHWVSALDEVPADAPLFLVANEFFDALPVRQYVKQKDGWHERMVGADNEKLVFALAPGPTPMPDAPVAQDGAVFEISPMSRAVANIIATRINAVDGVALIIDYGPQIQCHLDHCLGDTLQAVRAHKPTDVLAEPGEADITTHVDFAALAATARAAQSYVLGPMYQGDFLEELGIKTRAERLRRAAQSEAAAIDAAVHRLTDHEQMGTLFKAMAICEGAHPGAPGFVE